MTDFVLKFTSRQDVRAFNMLAGFFSDDNAKEAIKDAGITKNDLQAMTKAEATQLAIAASARGYEPLVGYKRDAGFERTFHIFEDVQRPTGATTTDEFGNTVPVYTTLSGVYVYYRHNGDEPLNRLNFARNMMEGTIEWRSDNVGGEPDAEGNPTPEPLPEWFPRIA